ncbi:hypothetical protein VC83_00683 [Pseudogymnoascus destructans]|nr:uncharacterized protein VC83_00683 [Pseudogymnoascus destructans]OAF62792.1 hypothetical protein VC83_00683 [Pseudogymnoascus destructans]
MTNPKSVANRIAVMKKKYGLPLATSTSKAAARVGDLVDGNNDAAIGTQASPVKRTPKKNAARKAPYKIAKREETLVQRLSDDNVDGDRQSAIDTDEMEKMVFGNPDDEENDGDQDSMAVMVHGNHDIV